MSKPTHPLSVFSSIRCSLYLYAAILSFINLNFSLFEVCCPPNILIWIIIEYISSLFCAFASFEHIFFRLKAMAKKVKSMVILSFPICLKRRYTMLYFIWPKTASGSIHRLPLCLIPSCEVSLSRACCLYWFSR